MTFRLFHTNIQIGMMNEMEMRDVIYSIGLGAICAYYLTTCEMFIMAFILRKHIVIIDLNHFGELTAEFIITMLSIPCAIYTVIESMKLRKAGNRCIPSDFEADS